MQNTSITIFGNDSRSMQASRLLAADGFNVSHVNSLYDLEKINEIKYALMPIPYSDKNGFVNGLNISLTDIAPKLSNSSFVILGKADKYFIDVKNITGFEFADIVDNIHFKQVNGLLTAEAAISIAIEGSSKALYKSNVLVSGFGCIAKPLVKLLLSFGCNVTVVARKESDRACAEALGCRSCDFNALYGILAAQDIIFNTCPAMIFSAEKLVHIKNNAIIIDLASRPGGCDFEYAETHGINAKLYLSLPDKYSPASSGRLVYETVKLLISEHERSLYDLKR